MSDIKLKRKLKAQPGGSLDRLVSTPRTDAACFQINTESLNPFDDLADFSRKLERETVFFRDLLKQITQDHRRTRARRLAESGLIFWDELQKEAAKRSGANTELTDRRGAGSVE